MNHPVTCPGPSSFEFRFEFELIGEFQGTFPSSHLMAEDSSHALVAGAGGGGGKKFVPAYVPCIVCETLVVQKPGMHLDLDFVLLFAFTLTLRLKVILILML